MDCSDIAKVPKPLLKTRTMTSKETKQKLLLRDSASSVEDLDPVKKISNPDPACKVYLLYNFPHAYDCQDNKNLSLIKIWVLKNQK